MPISRIKTDGIQDEAVTSAKIGDNIDLDGQFVRVPHGTTAERPSSPAAGYMRFNTTLGTLEQWNTNTNNWAAIDSPPIITSLTYSGSLTAADTAGGETITLTGSNFKSGLTIDIGATTAPTVTFVDSTSITFTTPAKTAGDYDVKLTNPNGLSATLTNGISYNGLPAFTTASGSLGTLNPDEAMSTITIVAAEPDGGTLAYSITSGALPTGVSLGSANGQLTGTPTNTTAGTETSNFTVQATDDENQTNTRNFSLSVYRPVYNLKLANAVRLDTTSDNYLVRDNRLIGSGMAQGGDTFTVACWVKKEKDGAKDVFLIGTNTGTSARFIVYVNGNNLRFYGRNSSSVVQFDVVANNVIPDSTAWYHVMMVFDTTNSTANDTTRFYVNGTRVAQSQITTNNSAQGNGANGIGLQLYEIGRHNGDEWSDGYIADYHFIWDVAKTDPYEFIASYRGTIVPKTYTGSYGTYGFHLDFADSALTASGIGNDNAGIGDFTPYNFSNNVTSTGVVVTDTPTSNHSTLMDMSHNGAAFNKGMLRSTHGGRYFAAGNTAVNSGKWYWEYYSTHFSTSVGGVVFGLIPVAEMGRADADTGDLHSWGALGGRIISGASPYYYVSGGSQTTFGTSSTFSTTDTVGFSVDFDNDEFKVYTTGDGVAVLTIDISSITDDWPWLLPAGGGETGSQTKTIHWNFGQDDFAISGGIPSGFKAISEANKGEPTITPLSDATHVEGAFKALTYTGSGDGNTNSVNVGFQPDLTILKSRTQTYTPYLFDSIRGNNNYILPSETNSQSTLGSGHSFTFTSTGFDITSSGGSALNEAGQGADNMQSYSWKAGGAPSATNSATSGAMTANSVSLNGTLQSAYTPSGSPTVYPKKMSVNTEAGFSIVEYNTGSNGDNFTVPHGLGKKPKVIWTKGGYDSNTYNWDVYNYWTSTGGANYNGHLGRLKLNTDDGFENLTGDVPWGDTAPTSDVWTVGNSGSSSADYYGANKNNIAYIWTDVPGFSDFGFYRGNGNSTGPYIYTGFKPSVIIVKNVSANGTSWVVLDSASEDDYNKYRRLSFNNSLVANTNSSTSARFDFLSNGFRSVGGDGSFVNADGSAYIYMAFAEMPAKYSIGIENLGD